MPAVSIRQGTADRRRCLVADDDPSFQSIASYSLRRAGFEVVLASSGAEVFAKVGQGHLDVCLVDQGLPDITGCAVLRELRSRDIHTPVIIVSGAPSVREVVEAMRGGAFNFIEKPIPVGALVDSLLHACYSYTPNVPRSYDGPAAAVQAELLVQAMLPVIYAPADIPTVRLWAYTVHSSEPVLYGRCAANAVRAKNSLDLARLLRVAVLPVHRRARVLDMFGNRDMRSVGALLQRSGISRGLLSTASPPVLLDAQKCIHNSGVLGLLRGEVRSL